MDYTRFADQLGTSSNYARSNLFEVSIQLMDATLVVKSASLPAATVGVIEVPYQNRKLKVPGDRTFQDWTVTIINDEDMTLRSELLAWQASIQGFKDDFGSDGSDPLGHHRVLTVTPKDRTLQNMFDVKLYGWPSEIGSVDLSWETADTVQEYTVTFSITHDDQDVNTGF